MAGPTIIAKFLADTSKMQDGVDKATSGMADSLGGFAKKAAVALGAAFAVDKVIEFGKASVEAAAADAEAQAKLAQTLKNVTGATDDQIASNEDYISALSKSAAIADDDLRPAMDKLVRGFGNAEDAQKALALATDVSAGSGKELSTVTDALMKAANGSTGALAKMGVEVKNADGSAKSLDQIMAEMAQTFSGQAGVAAESTAGKMRNASIQFGEFQEQIGARLIPVIATLAGFFTGTLLPALDSLFNTVANSDAFKSFTAFVTDTLIPALQKAGEWFAQVVAPAVGAWITGTLVPALQSAADWIGRVAAPAVTEWFTNTLIPALQDTAKWITETLIPALEDARDAIGESGAFQAFTAAVKALGEVSIAGLQTAIGFIKDTAIPALVSLGQALNDNKDVLVSALVAIGVMLVATNIGFITLIPTAVGLFGLWVAGALSAAAATLLAAAPFILIGIAIAALVLLIIRNWDTIVEVTKAVVGAIVGFFQGAWDAIFAAVSGVVSWIAEHWQLLFAIITGPIGLAVALVVSHWDTITEAVGKVIAWITDHWQTILAVITGPIGIAVAIIATHWDTIKAGATAVWQWVTDKWNAIRDGISSAITAIGGFISTLVDVFFRRPIAAAQEMLAAVTAAFHSLVDSISNVVGSIGAAIGRIVDAIKGPINAILRGWNNLSFTIPTINVPEVDIPLVGKVGGGRFGGFSIDFPDLPLLAAGGVLTSPTMFVGGEAGTEIVAPEALLRTIVAEESGGGSYTLNLYPRTADANDVAYGFRRLEILAGVL